MGIELEPGFWIAEAAAMQVPLQTIPGVPARREGSVPVEVTFDEAPGGALSVIVNNRIVGFAPPSELDRLMRYRADSETSFAGELVFAEGLWRIWVGLGPRPVPPSGELAPPEPRIFGFSLRR